MESTVPTVHRQGGKILIADQVVPIPLLDAIREDEGNLNFRERRDLAKVLSNNYPGSENGDSMLETIDDTLEQTIYGNLGRFRRNGDPYAIHPISAAFYSREPERVPEILLHDTFEDLAKDLKAERPRDYAGIVSRVVDLYQRMCRDHGEQATVAAWKLTNKQDILAGFVFDRLEEFARYRKIIGRSYSVQVGDFHGWGRGIIKDTDSVSARADDVLSIIEFELGHLDSSDQLSDFRNALADVRQKIFDEGTTLNLTDVRGTNGYSQFKQQVMTAHYGKYIEDFADDKNLLLDKMCDMLNNVKTIQVEPESALRIFTKARILLDQVRTRVSQHGHETYSLNFIRIYYNLIDEVFRQYEIETDRYLGGAETANTPIAKLYYLKAEEFFSGFLDYSDELHGNYVDQLLRTGTPAEMSQELADQINAFIVNEMDFHDLYAYIQAGRTYHLLQQYADAYTDTSLVRNAAGWSELWEEHKDQLGEVLQHYERRKRRMVRRGSHPDNVEEIEHRIEDLNGYKVSERPLNLRSERLPTLKDVPFHIIQNPGERKAA